MSASETSLADTSHEAIPSASNGTARIIVRADQGVPNQEIHVTLLNTFSNFPFQMAAWRQRGKLFHGIVRLALSLLLVSNPAFSQELPSMTNPSVMEVRQQFL